MNPEEQNLIEASGSRDLFKRSWRGGERRGNCVWTAAPYRRSRRCQSATELFIALFGMVGRKIRRCIAFVVARPTANGIFQQPLPDAICTTTTLLASLAQQGRLMDGVAWPAYFTPKSAAWGHAAYNKAGCV